MYVIKQKIKVRFHHNHFRHCHKHLKRELMIGHLQLGFLLSLVFIYASSLFLGSDKEEFPHKLGLSVAHRLIYAFQIQTLKD